MDAHDTFRLRAWLPWLLVLSVLLIAGGLLAARLGGGAVVRAVAPVVASLGAGGLATGLMLWWAPGLLDTLPTRHWLRIGAQTLVPLLAYMALVSWLPGHLPTLPPGPLRVLLACLPAVAVLASCVTFARYLRLLDELQQRVELLALALATAGLLVAAAALAFMHLAGVVALRAQAVAWAFPALAIAYGVARAGLTRKYQ